MSYGSSIFILFKRTLLFSIEAEHFIFPSIGTWDFFKAMLCCVCSVMSDSFVTPWTVSHQAPLFMEFSRQGYWSVLPFPSPGDLPDPGIEPGSPTL